MPPPPPPPHPLRSRVELRRSSALRASRRHQHYRRTNYHHQHHRLAQLTNTSVALRAATPRYSSTSRRFHQTPHSLPSTQALVSRVANSPALATRGTWVAPLPRRRLLWNARGNTPNNHSATHRTMPSSVVLDGLSIGQAGSTHSNGSVSLNAILNALSFYTGSGARVVVILPEHTHICSIEKKQFQQHVALLRHRGLLVIAPCSGQSFNCFILRTAYKFGADLVSNNRFEPQVLAQQRDRVKIGHFLRTHLVPFAFCLREFVPHPDASAIASGLHGPRIQSALSVDPPYNARLPYAAIANKRR